MAVSSGSYRASDVIDIGGQEPQPAHHERKCKTVLKPAGKSWNATLAPIGVEGTLTSPHWKLSACPRQLRAARRVFAQLSLRDVEQVTHHGFSHLYPPGYGGARSTKKEVQVNIKAAIDKLRLFMVRDGFSHWPGAMIPGPSWGSTYAATFWRLRAKGYFEPMTCLSDGEVPAGQADITDTGNGYAQGRLCRPTVCIRSPRPMSLKSKAAKPAEGRGQFADIRKMDAGSGLR